MARDEIWQNATTYVPSFETCKSLWEHGVKLTKSMACYLNHGGGDYGLEFWFPELILKQAYEGKDIGWHAYPAPFAQDIYAFLFLNPTTSLAIKIDIQSDCPNVIIVMAYSKTKGFHKRYTIANINFAEQFALIAIDIAAAGLLEEATPIEKP